MAELDLGFNPTTAVAANYVQDSACAGTYANVDGGGTAGTFGNISSTSVFIQPGTPTFAGRLNKSTSTSATVANRLGMSSVTRTGPTAGGILRNGAVLTSGLSASAAMISGQFAALRTNTWCADRLACAYFGGGLTTAENLDLYNAVLAYLTAIGAS